MKGAGAVELQGGGGGGGGGGGLGGGGLYLHCSALVMVSIFTTDVQTKKTKKQKRWGVSLYSGYAGTGTVCLLQGVSPMTK